MNIFFKQRTCLPSPNQDWSRDFLMHCLQKQNGSPRLNFWIYHLSLDLNFFSYLFTRGTDGITVESTVFNNSTTRTTQSAFEAEQDLAVKIVPRSTRTKNVVGRSARLGFNLVLRTPMTSEALCAIYSFRKMTIFTWFASPMPCSWCSFGTSDRINILQMRWKEKYITRRNCLNRRAHFHWIKLQIIPTSTPKTILNFCSLEIKIN